MSISGRRRCGQTQKRDRGGEDRHYDGLTSFVEAPADRAAYPGKVAVARLR